METILIVESNTIQRNLYAEEFGCEGYNVVCAADGIEALTIHDSAHPDIVILDNHLPQMSGYELMSRLLALEPDLPLVINSATPAFLEPFASWMADAYVLKSSNLDELKACTHALLSKHAWPKSQVSAT